jgi:type II secretory pathway predicted ATPase ExeA
MPVPSALDETQLRFCEQLKAFCIDQKISVRQLAALCDGDRNCLSKSTADRVLHGTVDPFYLDRLRPVIASGLARHFDAQGMHADAIEELLVPIFEIKEFKSMLFNRCQLDPPVTRHFGLKFDPFDVDRIPAKDELFTTPEIDACVQRVKDAILYQRFVAVIGEVGSGKTLLKMRVAAELAEEKGLRARLLYPEFFDQSQVNVGEIASFILREYEQKVPQSRPERVRRIKALLGDLYDDDIRPALVIDECHRLNDRVISSLKNFWEMTNGAFSRLLGVVLFGQPAFVNSRLREVVFKEIRQRVQIIEMPSFAGAARGYVEHRIKLAGGDAGKLFESNALDTICRHAATPLSLGNLVNEALLEAFDKEETKVQSSFPFFKKLGDTPQVLNMRRSA